TSPAAAAYRDRIRDQFTQRYDERAAAQAELDALTAAQPPAEDPALLDELPYAPALLADAPEEIRAHVYAAFQVHALYRAEPHQATLTATITDQTPGIIQALTADPRTDHDTADPERKNSPTAAIARNLRDHGLGGRNSNQVASIAGTGSGEIRSSAGTVDAGN